MELSLLLFCPRPARAIAGFAYVLAVLSGWLTTGARAAEEGDPLVEAGQVRRLSMADANRRLPVRLRGVVTVVGPANVYYFHDESGGVLLSVPRHQPSFEQGDLVEISGTTLWGQLVPWVVVREWRMLGRAALPSPARLSSDDFVLGRRLSEWVEIEGVVRSAMIGSEGCCTLRVDLGARVVEAMLIRASLDECEALVGARVAARGVMAGYVNRRRQMAELYMRVNSRADIEVIEPAVPDPFALPAIAPTDLMLFSPTGQSGRRIKLRGTVLGQRAGSVLFMRDGESTVVIHSPQPGLLAPGDLVEVVGFSEMGPINPRVRDAVFRRVASGPPPQARVVGVDEIRRGQLDGELVTLQATLMDVSVAGEETTFMLESGGFVLRARLPTTENDKVPWREGSRLQVTGLFWVETTQKPAVGIQMVAREVELWLRGAADVVVTQPPPWWTRTRLAVVIGLVVAGALAALAWVAMLHRRVEEQTETIREKIRNETIAEERQRIAREFHDTLEQELAGLAMRLDLLRIKVADSAAGPLAHALQRLARRLQDEARHFIWNLHERRWESTTLAEALADAVAERHEANGVTIELVTEGEPRRLPDVKSHHLLRIGQEAVTNAVQHAAASRVNVCIRFSQSEVALVVIDDGRGFEPAKVSGRRAGHFGLSGMSERARRIGATLRLSSEPGRGTTIEVSLSLEASPFPP